MGVALLITSSLGTDGTRVTFQALFLQGGDYTKSAIVRNGARDLCVVVAQLPGACSVTGIQNVEGNVVTVATEKDVMVPWSFVVKGEPSGDTKKVIDAAKELVK